MEQYTTFDAIKTTSNKKDVIIFGAGNICSKTIRHLDTLPKKIVDNSQNLWGTEQDGIPISKPEDLTKVDDNYYVVICTTSFAEVSKQLDGMGLLYEQDYCVSPVLNDWRKIEELDNVKTTLLVTSGLSSSGTSSEKGGLYKIDISNNDHKVTHVHSGSSHGIIQANQNIIFVDDERGVVEIGKDLKTKRSVELPRGIRAHGISFSEEKNNYFVPCSYTDKVIVLNECFEIIDEIKISPKSEKASSPQHHVNDCMVWGDSLYVSMFSITGNWKKDVFDGGIVEYDINTHEKLGVVVSGLYMPHNVFCVSNGMGVLDSMTGRLLMNNMQEEGSFSGFTRGISWDDKFLYIGQSRNRNFSAKIGVKNNISIDSGVVVFDNRSKLSKFIKLPDSITEIHGLLVVQ